MRTTAMSSAAALSEQRNVPVSIDLLMDLA